LQLGANLAVVGKRTKANDLKVEKLEYSRAEWGGDLTLSVRDVYWAA
jgi:hypothetical protein